MNIFIKWLFDKWTVDERFRIEYNGLHDEYKIYRIMERGRWRGWYQRASSKRDLEEAEYTLRFYKNDRILSDAKFVPITTQHRVEQALEKSSQRSSVNTVA